MLMRQTRLASLQQSTREAVLLLLSAIPDDEFDTVVDAAHGEVTLEFRLPARHPILEQLPPPPTTRQQTFQSSAALSPPSRQVIRNPSTDHNGTTGTRVLRNASGRPPSPLVRQTSPLAAASRKGAAARTRSLSRSPSPKSRTVLSSHPVTSSGSQVRRSVAWASKQVDEIFAATRRMRVDTQRISHVEELLMDIIASRFGVTLQHRRLLPELVDVAHSYADMAPLCHLFYIYAGKRSSEALTEFITIARFLGAVLPWSSTETLKMTHHHSSGSTAVLVPRRYITFGDLPLALRDALPLVAPRGSFLLNETRRWLHQWCHAPTRHPPIAFDFEGHVDTDVLALMLIDALREAKSAVPVESQWGRLGEIGLPEATSWASNAADEQSALREGTLVSPQSQRLRGRSSPGKRLHVPPTSTSMAASKNSTTSASRYRSAMQAVAAPPSVRKGSPVVVSLSPRQPLRHEFGIDDVSDVPSDHGAGEESAHMQGLHEQNRRTAALRDLLNHDSVVQTAKAINRSVPPSLPPRSGAGAGRQQQLNMRRQESVVHQDDDPFMLETIEASPLRPTAAATRQHYDGSSANQRSDRPESEGSSEDDEQPAKSEVTSLRDMRAALQAIEEEIRRRKEDSSPRSPPRPHTRQPKQHPQQHRDPLTSVLGDDELSLLAQLEASLQSRSVGGSSSRHPWSPPRPLESVAMS